MPTPPLLLGAALVFWGLRAGLLLPALVMAVLLEGSRTVRLRFDLPDQDYNRITDLCGVAFIAAFFYIVLTRHNQYPDFFLLLVWSPMIALPLALAQVYGEQDRIALSSLSLLARRMKRYAGEDWGRVNLVWPYLALVLFAALATRGDSRLLLAAMTLFLGWSLAAIRPARPPLPLWVLLLALVLTGGMAAHTGLMGMGRMVERFFIRYYMSHWSGTVNTSLAHTSMGELGERKLSDRIVLRVRPQPGRMPPPLLRDGLYDIFQGGTWYAGHPEFVTVDPLPGGTSWPLAVRDQRVQGPDRLDISVPLPDGKGRLPLPAGTRGLARFSAELVEMDRMGTVRVDGAGDLAVYQAWGNFSERASLVASGPEKNDLVVPASLSPLLAKLIQDQDLARPEARESVAAVRDFLRDRCSYALNSGGSLYQFLTSRPQGHCEHFASATVLLLRAAGVPARYATGWAVKEYSRLERAFVVRGRHAHAWCLAWVDGAWVQVDSTPAGWADLDPGQAWYTGLADLAALAWYRFTLWRQGDMEEGLYIGAVLVVILLVIILRGFSGRRKRRRTRNQEGQAASAGPLDPQFHRLELALAAAGLAREPWEPARTWLRRIAPLVPAELSTDALERIAACHERLCFDPAADRPAETRRLQALVDAALAATGSPPREARTK